MNNLNEVTIDPGLAFIQLLGKELASEKFDLPRFPETALRIHNALKDPDISIDSLSNIVLTEAMLTVRLLKMANSAMMQRGPMEVTDVKVAMSRIGLKMVQSAAMSLAADEAFKAPSGSLMSMRLNKIRKHSAKVCSLAYVLAKKVAGRCNPDDAMLAGLLHSIGKFYILARADESPELVANEAAMERLLSEWYTGVGRAIVEFWGFPQHITDAVDEHELIDRMITGSADLTDIIVVANFLAKTEQDKAEVQAALDKMPSVLRMHLDGESLLKYIEDTDEEISSMMHALSD